LSIQNDLKMVKEELNSEEKFFEKAVLTERFVKKYKNLMIGSFVAVVVVVGANIAYDINRQSKIDEANNCLAKLEISIKDTNSLKKLKELSPNLYNVWLYSRAIANKDDKTLQELKNSDTLIVDDLASYESAKTLKELDEYSLRQNAIFKDLAVIESAIILINQSKIDEAHQKLAQIALNSSLMPVAKALMHYGVK